MTTFRVWAPDARRVEVEAAGGRHPMRPEADTEPAGDGRDGWWVADVPAAGHGSDYGFFVDGEGRVPGEEPVPEPLPDPRSLWQPYGVHGRSRVYEHGRFPWTDQGRRGRPLAGSVLYELHIGTFTEGGTFDSAIERLDHLVDLGVDAVELLPVAAFPGRYGWGYDGVHLWAVHDPYGGPDGLKRFVDACHARDLSVVLDVVYNHVGPSGNYLGRFGPYFTEAYRTPWGDAVNFDRPGSDEVRAFVIENALMWLRDYHIDGLRLDAVHAIDDHRAVHILAELAAEVAALEARVGRDLFLIAESDLNDPRLVTPYEADGHGLDAHWNDDFHHALHANLTGELHGYYEDFAGLRSIEKTLMGAYFHDGTLSTFRGRHHGRPVDRQRIPGHRFLVFVQNHDQIGNRATGDRISGSLSPGQLKIASALLLTSPFTPMLFMGEEWGASTPWCYFTDHVDPEIAEAVRKGRRAEFAHHGWNESEVPDPQDPRTALRSVLDWAEPDEDGHRELLDWYRRLIALRRERPELADARLHAVRVTRSSDEDTDQWVVVHRGALRVAANLAASPVRLAASRDLSLPGCGLSTAPGDAMSRSSGSPPTRCFALSAKPGDGLSPVLLLTSEPDVSLDAGTLRLPAHSVAIVSVSGPTPPILR